MPSARSWRVPEECRLEWREWGGLHVVFNPASGDTHLLNDVSATVLKALESSTLTVEELGARAARTSDLEGLLEELDELGLIAPAGS